MKSLLKFGNYYYLVQKKDEAKERLILVTIQLLVTLHVVSCGNERLQFPSMKARLLGMR